MPDFFSSTEPGQKVSHGNAEFELPILYFRDDLFLMFFVGNYAKVKAMMPSPRLHPVSLLGGEGSGGDWGV